MHRVTAQKPVEGLAIGPLDGRQVTALGASDCRGGLAGCQNLVNPAPGITKCGCGGVMAEEPELAA